MTNISGGYSNDGYFPDDYTRPNMVLELQVPGWSIGLSRASVYPEHRLVIEQAWGRTAGGVSYAYDPLQFADSFSLTIQRLRADELDDLRSFFESRARGQVNDFTLYDWIINIGHTVMFSQPTLSIQEIGYNSYTVVLPLLRVLDVAQGKPALFGHLAGASVSGPTVSTLTYGTDVVTLSCRQALPYQQDSRIYQQLALDSLGRFRTHDRSTLTTRTLTSVWPSMIGAELVDVLWFLVSTVAGARRWWTWVDDLGVTHTVRYAGFAWQQVGPDRYRATMNMEERV